MGNLCDLISKYIKELEIMLEFSKKILSKVSFDKNLFKKELSKR